jgi:hypothetical protein
VQGVRDRPHLLDGHAVDLADLVDQQLEVLAVGQLDHQLVHRLATVALEDVDADHVAADGADPAGDLAESTRPVGQPHADHERFHDRGHYGGPVNRLFPTRDGSVSTWQPFRVRPGSFRSPGVSSIGQHAGWRERG